MVRMTAATTATNVGGLLSLTHAWSAFGHDNTLLDSAATYRLVMRVTLERAVKLRLIQHLKALEEDHVGETLSTP